MSTIEEFHCSCIRLFKFYTSFKHNHCTYCRLHIKIENHFFSEGKCHKLLYVYSLGNFVGTLRRQKKKKIIDTEHRTMKLHSGVPKRQKKKQQKKNRRYERNFPDLHTRESLQGIYLLQVRDTYPGIHT